MEGEVRLEEQVCLCISSSKLYVCSAMLIIFETILVLTHMRPLCDSKSNMRKYGGSTLFPVYVGHLLIILCSY